MSILILSYTTDPHALAVRWGLRTTGVAAEIYSSAEYLTSSPLSAYPNSGRVEVSRPDSDLLGQGFRAEMSSFRTVWNRRISPVEAPADLHPADRATAANIGGRFLDDLRVAPVAGQTWVNDRLRQLYINSKVNQLSLAKSLGFRIPETIISNDPARVREFIAKHGKVIVKSLLPMVWRDERTNSAGSILAMTTRIDLAAVGNDIAVQGCPMIYQELINKASEYRVLVFGSEVLCVELNTQKQSATSLDWRAVNPNTLDLREVTPPDDLRARLLRFMREAGLLHGSFDFAVTPTGEHVFFEINEQGQTLWIEEGNEEIRVLDRLVQFMATPSPDFTYTKATDLRFTDYKRTNEWLKVVVEVAKQTREEREQVTSEAMGTNLATV